MFAKVIANRYARALLNTCEDSAAIEKAQDEIEMLGIVYRTSEPVRAFLLNPKVPPAIKVRIFEKALEGRISKVVLDLLLLLIRKRRQDIVPDVADRFSEICDDIRGVEHAEVTTAIDLDESLKGRLESTIQTFSERKVDVVFKRDPDIIGGLIIRMGDRVIDGSLSRRFEEIRRNMLAVRLPATSLDSDSDSA